MKFDYLIKHNADVSRSEVWVKFFVYPLSMPLSYCVINWTHLSANQITIIGFFSAFVGSLLSLFCGLKSVLIGYCCAYVLDFVDGQVAKAKGSSKIGAILDMGTDRFSLISAAVALSWIHHQQNNSLAIVLLMAYLAVYFFMDSLYLARLSVANKKTVLPKTKIQNTVKNVFGVWYNWFPQRLSSPLFVMGAWAITGKPTVAYLVGFVCVLPEIFLYIQSGLKKVL